MLGLPDLSKRDHVLPPEHNRRLPLAPYWGGPGRYSLWVRDKPGPGARTLAVTRDIACEEDFDTLTEVMRFTLWSSWVREPFYDLRTAVYELIPLKELN